MLHPSDRSSSSSHGDEQRSSIAVGLAMFAVVVALVFGVAAALFVGIDRAASSALPGAGTVILLLGGFVLFVAPFHRRR